MHQVFSEYERPEVFISAMENTALICVSTEGSNGDYSEVIIDWDDEQ